MNKATEIGIVLSVLGLLSWALFLAATFNGFLPPMAEARVKEQSYKAALRSLQEQAVTEGIGRWVVTTAKGKVKFVWNKARGKVSSTTRALESLEWQDND